MTCKFLLLIYLFIQYCFVFGKFLLLVPHYAFIEDMCYLYAGYHYINQSNVILERTPN